MTWGRICRFLGFMTVLLFVGCAFTPLPNLLAHWSHTPSRVEPAGAIVVLAGGLHEDGTLSDHSLRRALHGIVLYRKELAPLLVLSSGPVHRRDRTEGEVRAELALDLGIPLQAVLGVVARTTREEALLIKAVLQPRGVHRILLVTDSLHMTRAQPLFEQAGFEVLPAAADDIANDADSPEDRLVLMRRVLLEVVARAYYRLFGYL